MINMKKDDLVLLKEMLSKYRKNINDINNKFFHQYITHTKKLGKEGEVFINFIRMFEYNMINLDLDIEKFIKEYERKNSNE